MQDFGHSNQLTKTNESDFGGEGVSDRVQELEVVANTRNNKIHTL
jgi:hypothetical protein